MTITSFIYGNVCCSYILIPGDGWIFLTNEGSFSHSRAPISAREIVL